MMREISENGANGTLRLAGFILSRLVDSLPSDVRIA